jgi:hypothetical protein
MFWCYSQGLSGLRFSGILNQPAANIPGVGVIA